MKKIIHIFWGELFKKSEKSLVLKKDVKFVL